MFLKKANKDGFTIVEMIVSLAIVLVILSVVLFNYSSFTDNLALSAAAQDLAITIRQAQTYGLSVKESATNSQIFNYAYGVYIDTVANTGFTLFADADGDKFYDSSPTDEAVQKVTFRNGIKISGIGNETSSPPPSSNNKMSIIFMRPNPDAKIYFTGGTGNIGPSLTGKITLVSPKGKTITVTVQSTGQVLVK